eukprot:1184548-Prorocentrum_minimum.AAC.4
MHIYLTWQRQIEGVLSRHLKGDVPAQATQPKRDCQGAIQLSCSYTSRAVLVTVEMRQHPRDAPGRHL